jgi:hypothetical protein
MFRAVFDPLYYMQVFAGPLGALAQHYSALSQAQKGHVSEALSVLVGRYIPIENVVETLHEIATGGKGKSGESPTQDFLPDVVGGYYKKADPHGQ